MATVRASATRTEETIKSLGMESGQVTAFQAEAQRIEQALQGARSAALTTTAAIHDVGFSPTQVAEDVAEARIIQHAVAEIGEEARRTQRRLDRLRITETGIISGASTGRPGAPTEDEVQQEAARRPFIVEMLKSQQSREAEQRGLHVEMLKEFAAREQGRRGLALEMQKDFAAREEGRRQLVTEMNRDFASREDGRRRLEVEMRRDFESRRRNVLREIERLEGGRGGGGIRLFGGGGGGGDGGGGGIGREDARFQPGDLVRGILPGGRRAGAGALGLLAALGIGAAPELLAGAGGLGLAGVAGGGALVGGGATVMLSGISDVIKGLSDQKTYQGLDQTQKSLANLMRTVGGGFGANIGQIAQRGVLPGIQAGIVSALTPNTVHALTQSVQAFSSAVGDSARSWGRFFGSTEFSTQFGQIMQRNAGYFRDFSANTQRAVDVGLRFVNQTHGVVDWLDRVSTSALKNAQAWSQSARGQQQMKAFSDLAIRGLQDFGHVLRGAGDALKQLFDILGGLSVLNLLARALEGLASFLKQNKDVLRNFFAGAQQAINDLFAVIGQITRMVQPVLGALNAVASAIGGWRIPIEVISGLILGKMVFAWAAAKGAALAMAAATEAKLATLTAQLVAYNALLAGTSIESIVASTAAAGTVAARAGLGFRNAAAGILSLVTPMRLAVVGAALVGGALYYVFTRSNALADSFQNLKTALSSVHTLSEQFAQANLSSRQAGVSLVSSRLALAQARQAVNVAFATSGPGSQEYLTALNAEQQAEIAVTQALLDRKTATEAARKAQHDLSAAERNVPIATLRVYGEALNRLFLAIHVRFVGDRAIASLVKNALDQYAVGLHDVEAAVNQAKGPTDAYRQAVDQLYQSLHRLPTLQEVNVRVNIIETHTQVGGTAGPPGVNQGMLALARDAIRAQRAQAAAMDLAMSKAKAQLALATTPAAIAAANAAIKAIYDKELAMFEANNKPGANASQAEQKAYYDQLAQLAQAGAAYGPPTPFETNVPKAKKGVFDPLSVAQHEAISQAQQALAQARTSGDINAQVQAAQTLQRIYQQTLTAVRAEHETGRNRVRQLAEEATLANRIASTHRQILALIKEQNAATLVSDLGQGPYLTSANAQIALSFGYKPTGQDYLRDIKAQVAAAAQENRDLAMIGRRLGHDPRSQALIASLRGEGAQGAALAHELAGMTRAQLREYERFFARRQAQTRVAQMTVTANVVHVHGRVSPLAHRDTSGGSSRPSPLSQRNTSGANDRMQQAASKFRMLHFPGFAGIGHG